MIKMQINGPAHLHGAQAINPPHHNTRASRASEAHVSSLAQVDQLDISHEADLVSRVRELPAIRQDRVDEIRAQITSGVYETDDKINGALERLLDEIG
jgi:anti-sigma28 factor (negative regulator of flagellin synthesis)